MGKRRLLLAASLIANVLLGAIAARWGARWLAARRTPAERPALLVARQAHFDELVRPSGAAREVVMLGDSLTQWGEWWELLGRPVANRGVESDTLARIAERLDAVVALAPKAVFLLAGVNDLREGRTPDEVASSYAGLLRELRRRLPHARIIAQSLLPVRERDGEAAGGDHEVTGAAIVATNARLAPVAAQAGASWLDVAAALRDPSGQLDARYSSDGLHLTADGYRAWATALAPHLP